MTGVDNLDASLRLLRAKHRVNLSEEAGGWSWFCGCGREGRAGASANYPTEAQARARSDRHLIAARRQIQRDIGDPLILVRLVDDVGMLGKGATGYRVPGWDQDGYLAVVMDVWMATGGKRLGDGIDYVNPEDIEVTA